MKLRPSLSQVWALGLLSWAALAGPTHAAPILLSVAGDGWGVPNQLIRIDLDAASVAPAATLGAGFTGYAGGLATLGGSLYGIESDGMGNAHLVSISPGGEVAPLVALGPGAFGGLASNGADLFAIRNDFLGDSHLVRIDLGSAAVDELFHLGQGFTGGLAYRSDLGFFFAIGNDWMGASSLYSINPAAQSVTLESILLGSGFLGGLAWDSSGQRFFAIGNDWFANSTLYAFTLSSPTPEALLPLGPGFLFAGLTSEETGNPPADVPEPSTLLLSSAALLTAGLVRRRSRH